MTERVYVDTSVLIAAWRAQSATNRLSLAELTRPNRQLVTSVFVELEVKPLPAFRKNGDEMKFYDDVFAVSHIVRATHLEVIAKARELGPRFGIAGMDAPHLSAAVRDGCKSIVSADSDFARAKPAIAPNILRAA
jgi:predicted nucleic acid-binding protein